MSCSLKVDLGGFAGYLSKQNNKARSTHLSPCGDQATRQTFALGPNCKKIAEAEHSREFLNPLASEGRSASKRQEMQTGLPIESLLLLALQLTVLLYSVT
jgi:hypothetical protein